MKGLSKKLRGQKLLLTIGDGYAPGDVSTSACDWSTSAALRNRTYVQNQNRPHKYRNGKMIRHKRG